MSALQEAVPIIFSRGWTPVALGLDAKGKPKRPLAAAWQRIPHDMARVKAQPWATAQGMGIILGPASDNLAVIDIDDNALASRVFATLVRGHVYTRMAWTGRKNLHVYVREKEPSEPKIRRITWQGREIPIELKAKGQQVAAPPTPGYSICDREGWKPIEVPTVLAAWLSIEKRLGIEPPTEAAQNYPKPWGITVPAGERNRAAFVEACRLREAGMPFEQARELMQSRFNQAYEPGESWHAIEKTIRSAYRRGALSETDGLDQRWRGERLFE